MLAVLLVSQAAGLLLIAGVVLVRGEGPPGGDFVLYAALSSLAGTAGLAAFYRGLAVGAMGVVAPISATAAAIPVAFGVATGERPSAVQGAGIALALLGVALASRESSDAAERGGRIATGVGLALIAALGFGTFLTVIGKASEQDVLWAILANRVVGVLLLSGVAVWLRPGLPATTRELSGVMAIGVFDITANTLYAAATTQGLVSVVAVLASLYPITTVVLAHTMLRERVQPVQGAGAAAALAGVALLTAG